MALTWDNAQCNAAPVTTNPPSSDDEHIADEPGPLTFAHQPSDQQRKAGVVACFVHRPGNGEDWVVQGDVSRSPQGLVISRMEIWPGTPGDEPYASVTARILRAVPVGEILSKVTSTAFVMEPLLAESSYPLTPQAPADEKPRPGRAPLTDELLREIALEYLEETRPGMPRGAVQRMAAKHERPVPTISRWLKRAREDQWLGPAAQGREGGEAGPRLVAAEVRAALDKLVGPEVLPVESSDFRQRGAAETDRPFDDPPTA